LVLGADAWLTQKLLHPIQPGCPFSQNREPNASFCQRETDEDVFKHRDTGLIAKFNPQGRRVMKKTFLLSALIAAGITMMPLAPAAFADDMKKDTMSKDTMSKDSMKKDTMGKDTMGKDSMKKDDMAKDNMSKDNMKK
jgi:pentapeptide MXKDX repeat protein